MWITLFVTMGRRFGRRSGGILVLILLSLLIASGLSASTSRRIKGKVENSKNVQQLRANGISLARRKDTYWNAPTVPGIRNDAPVVTQDKCDPIFQFEPTIDAVKVFPTLGFNVRPVLYTFLLLNVRIFRNFDLILIMYRNHGFLRANSGIGTLKPGMPVSFAVVLTHR